jgi:glutamate 5-kinase
MITKIQAAKMALNADCPTIITNGIEDNALKKLNLGSKKYTIFCKKNYDKNIVNYNKNLTENNFSNPVKIKKITTKKNWLSGIVNAKAELIIDKKASETLIKNKVSLLAVGVIEIKGNFAKGDVVYIKNQQGIHIASGIVNYGKKDAEKILKKNSQEIRKILGKSAKPELVHLDNLVIVN